MEGTDKTNFEQNFGRFKTVSKKETEELLAKKKAKATDKVTKLWVDCLHDYLIEKGHPKLDDI